MTKMQNQKEQLPVKPAEGEAKTTIGVGSRGLILRSLDDMYRFSRYVSVSGLAPKGLEKPEAILIALQYGMELGLSPAQSLQNIAVVNGRPTLWGDTMLALCMASPHWDENVFHEWFEGDYKSDGYAAFCRVGRLGRKEPIERSFSIGDAKASGLWGKSGPWQQYPRRMLQMRARSWALRDAFPDILRGCLSAEEMRDSAIADDRQESGVAGLRKKLGTEQHERESQEPADATIEVEPDMEEEVQSLLDEMGA